MKKKEANLKGGINQNRIFVWLTANYARLELFFGHQPSKPKLSLLFFGHFGLLMPSTVITPLLSFYRLFPIDYLDK
jgi:hypothetical protein